MATSCRRKLEDYHHTRKPKIVGNMLLTLHHWNYNILSQTLNFAPLHSPGPM